MPDNFNLSLWENLRPVDRKFTKQITGKSYRGDSPNPTYVIQKLTEVLGPIGDLWGFNVLEERIIEGRPHQIVTQSRVDYDPSDETGQRALTKIVTYEIVREQYHQVRIEFWRMAEDGTRRTFESFGGTPMLYVSRKGEWICDEDAAKKSLTDAYVKAASWLGACADIFLGLFDDKYSGASETPEPDAPPPTNGSGATSASTGTRVSTNPFS